MAVEHPPIGGEQDWRMSGHLRLAEEPTTQSKVHCPEQGERAHTVNPWSGVIEFDVRSYSRVSQETADRLVGAIRDFGIGASAYFEGTVLQTMIDVPDRGDESVELLRRVVERMRAVEPTGAVLHAEIEYWDPEGVHVTRSPIGEVAIRLTPTPVRTD